MYGRTHKDFSCGLTSKDFSPSEVSLLDLYIHLSGFSAVMMMLLSLSILGCYVDERSIEAYVAGSLLFIFLKMIIVKTFKERMRTYRSDTSSESAVKKKLFLEQIYALHERSTGKPSEMLQYYIARISLFEMGLIGAAILSVSVGMCTVFIFLVAILFGDNELVEHLRVAILLIVNIGNLSALGVMSSCLMRFRGMVFSEN